MAGIKVHVTEQKFAWLPQWIGIEPDYGHDAGWVWLTWFFERRYVTNEGMWDELNHRIERRRLHETEWSLIYPN